MTDATWPLTYGCTKVSPGCAHCYITRTPPYRIQGLRWDEHASIPIQLFPERLDWPLKWKKPRRIFVNSLSDLFHEDVPDDFIDKAFAVMALTPQHTYQVLTKRPERMREYIQDGLRRIGAACWNLRREHEEEMARQPHSTPWPLPNVWLGVTCENQRWADERIPILLDTPAAVRFVSAEPLLGSLSLRRYLFPANIPLPAINWLIVGGESGSGHRPFNPDWARDLLAQCRSNDGLFPTPFFCKQLGGYRPGNKLEDLPPDLQVREFPA